METIPTVMRNDSLLPMLHEYLFELRIVIAATGPDVYPARDYLLRDLLPELSVRCRTLGGTLVVIDMERRNPMSFSTSMFDALAGSRPYLIGLIGHHDYPALEPYPDRDLRRPYPWLRHGTATRPGAGDWWLIEEILANPLMAGHALFYSAGSSDDASTVSIGQPTHTKTRTAAMLATIHASGFCVREHCYDMETLGRWVREDINAIIENHLVHCAPNTPLESERRLHRVFATSRCREYVASRSSIDRLDEHVLGASPGQGGGTGLIVTGDSGAGKSALLAYWAGRYREKHPGAFIIEHYIGADSVGGGHIPLLRRIMAEIKDRYALGNLLPMNSKEVEQAFPFWLGNVQKETLVLLIDGLDQLAIASQGLAWLPDYLQPHLRLLVSTTVGPTLENLRERQWPELLVSPLRIEERREIVRRYFSAGRHPLSLEQLQHFSHDQWSANPLFLRTRLQEIQRFDASPELNERIDYFLDAGDLDDLFQRILQRLESEHDRGLVGDVLSLIWASRRGLSEQELAGLVASAGEALPKLLQALEHHLMLRSGLLTFFHDQMRGAVERRYVLGARQSACAVHRRLARYFAMLPAEARRADEEPWQLHKAMEWGLLCDCLADISLFMVLSEESTSDCLLAYWLAIGDRFDPAQVYRDSFERYEREREEQELIAPLGALGRFFSDAGRYAEAQEYGMRTLLLQEKVLGNAHADIAVTLDHLATLHYHMGRGAEAITLLRRALEIRERNFAPEHLCIARNLADLGAGLYAIGELDEAERHLVRALAIGDRQGRKGLPVVAMIVNNLGALRVAMRRYDTAITYFERAERINESLFGAEHPEVASNLVNHAYALQEQGNIRSAEQQYRKALAITETVLGPNHPQIAIVLTNLGALCRDTGDLDEAAMLFDRALRIRIKALGTDTTETIDSMKRLGYVLKCKHDYAQAARLYQESMIGYERIYGPAHPDVGRLREKIEEMLLQTG